MSHAFDVAKIHRQFDEPTQQAIEAIVVVSSLTNIFKFYLHDYLVAIDSNVSIDVIPKQEAIDDVKRKYPDRTINVLSDESILPLVKDHLLQREILQMQREATPFLNQFQQAHNEHKARYLAITSSASNLIARSTKIKVQRLGALLDKLASFSAQELHGAGHQVTRQNVILATTVQYFGSLIESTPTSE